MIRVLSMLLVGAVSASAQVRQGGVYQIQAETLDSGGGASSGGNYSARQSLPALGAMAGGGLYSVLSGFTGQLEGGGAGAGAAAFASWQTVLFGGPAGPGAGPYDDPDHDGIPNQVEFSFNL